MAMWKTLDPNAAKALSNARIQLHQAAQLAAAFGISYLPKKSDDSHTNLEWIERDSTLASSARDGRRIALRVPDLRLLIGSSSLPLNGRTISGAAQWIRQTLDSLGMEGSQYTLACHYEIPSHPVESGRTFDARQEDLEQLALWYSNAAAQFEMIRSNDSRASNVRCWPHHFDIATLITPSKGKSIGVGMEPGDKYYDEPYFYVNMNPLPPADSLADSLEGGGVWHTKEWVGAVLPGSRLTENRHAQQLQVERFLQSAIDTAKRILTL